MSINEGWRKKVDERMDDNNRMNLKNLFKLKEVGVLILNNLIENTYLKIIYNVFNDSAKETKLNDN